MYINEIRTEYAKPKVEFIEFKIAQDGNLGALKVFSSGISLDEAIYEFPSVEVKEGEYIVLYLRSLDPASVDETGSDLSLSPGAETSPTTREFWVPGTTKLTRKTDILYITNQDDQILDAVMLSENKNASWSKEELTTAANLLRDKGAWIAAGADILGPPHAVESQYATATRTICRDESLPDSNTLNDWYITATSSATPGAANNIKRYEPKS
jgi:hypothetical protein